jgi:hypothetical protein
MGAPPKYEENISALRVALINISLSSGRRGRRSFRTIRKKSSRDQKIINTVYLLYA